MTYTTYISLEKKILIVKLILSNTNKEEKQDRGKNPNFIYELGKFWGVKRKLKIRSKFGWSMKPLCQNAVIIL